MAAYEHWLSKHIPKETNRHTTKHLLLEVGCFLCYLQESLKHRVQLRRVLYGRLWSKELVARVKL
jgi:hypothetical protein